MCRLYEEHLNEGRWFLHEHPNSATYCKLPEMLALMTDLGITRAVAQSCRYSMRASDHMGAGRVKKPNGFVTNSVFLKEHLLSNRIEGHRHIQLVGGKARACQAYPDKLRR